MAVSLDPNFTDPILALSVLQACCPNPAFRDGSKALENAEKVCVLTDWKDWVSLSCVAAAYAELGDFEKAIQFAKQTEAIAPEEEKPTRAKRVRQFENGIPFRLPYDNPANEDELKACDE